MRSRFEFPEIEGKAKWNSEKYSFLHPNRRSAWTVLTTAENIKDIYKFVDQNAGDAADDSRKFQHTLIQQGANALESLYWLTKYHQYNAARGRARYLYETYLILRGLNRDRKRAAQKWEETRQEARDVSSQSDIKPLERQTQALHDLRKEERKRIEREFGDTDAYKEFWRLLSDRGSHPTSIRGSLVDGRHSVESEDSLYRTGLVLAFGLATQYICSFSGTEMRWPIQKRADHVIVETKLILQPQGLPTFLKDELYFWDPIRWRSPFID